MNDKKTLQDAIKGANLLSQSKIAWVVHPILEDMAERFAGYVGPYAVTESGRPLLQQSLKEAFAKYKKAQEGASDHSQAVREFARCLVSASVSVFSQQLTVETPSGDLVWMPFVCSANEFLAKAKADRKISCIWVEKRISSQICEAFMMTKILPTALLDMDSLAELLGETKVVT